MMVLGQYTAVLVGTWFFWVNIGWFWLIYDSAGSLQGSNGRYLVGVGQ